ncbi:unnamed protein product [Rhizoctonia solani]|uniref:Actin-like ATPase domain-containing protein n=1 Tax=Rhizoctonia solani TaxID=456999 RepID=A0A8H3B9U2_9AGAM|nr:unnamed protein product [Rhizoctonia solani]
MEVILGHPNGWSAREQSFLRNAAVECGVFNTPQATIAKNIKFVTEAEASVHYCIQHSNLSAQVKVGSRFAVCDAGGSTVDTTLYSVTSAHPDLRLKEVRESASVQAGGIFVNRAFEARLSEWMRGLNLTKGEVDEYTEEGLQDFEFTKRNFDYNDADQNAIVRVKVAGGRVSRGESSAMYAIRRGYVEVPSSDIKGCFDKCVEPITSKVDDLLESLAVGHILLVGGFGDSPYLRNVFKNKYEKRNIQITLANESSSKAVADGAVFWSIARSVVARSPHYSYGVICPRTCMPWIEELDGRRFGIGPGGIPVVLGAWSPIVQKVSGIPLDSDKVYRKTYTFTSKDENPESVSFSKDLHAYAGDGKPDWGLDYNDDLLPGFHKVGVIEGQIWDLEGALEHEEGLIPDLEYWKMDVDVCFQFGGTEFHAWVEWKQNGITRAGDATLVSWDPIK